MGVCTGSARWRRNRTSHPLAWCECHLPPATLLAAVAVAATLRSGRSECAGAGPAAGQPPPCDDADMEGACAADCGAAMDLESAGDENMMVPASPLQKRSPAAVLGGREAKRARLAEL